MVRKLLANGRYHLSPVDLEWHEKPAELKDVKESKVKRRSANNLFLVDINSGLIFLNLVPKANVNNDKKKVNLRRKKTISTPLRMEKPVRRPIVPPIKPNWASIVTFQIFTKLPITQTSHKNHLLIPLNLIVGCRVKVDVDSLQWCVIQHCGCKGCKVQSIFVPLVGHPSIW